MNLKLNDAELNIVGVDYAINEMINKMGLFTNNIHVLPTNEGNGIYGELVVFEVFTMDNKCYIGEITLPNSEECP